MKINYLSEFKLSETTLDGDISTPFKFTYYTPKSVGYVASYDGTTYKNCRRLSDGSLLVVFENHQLVCGDLYVRREYYLTDNDFSDGVLNLVTTQKCGIELTTDDTTDTTISTTVYPNYQCGASAYELAVKNGYEGSEVQWTNSLRPIPVVRDFDCSSMMMYPNIYYIHEADPAFIEFSYMVEGAEDVVNEYMLRFTTSDTLPTVYSPEGVTWIGAVDSDGVPLFKANTTYELSILEGKGIIVEL